MKVFTQLPVLKSQLPHAPFKPRGLRTICGMMTGYEVAERPLMSDYLMFNVMRYILAL